MESHYDHVIIGAGPAGMACAISLKKRGADCCVIDRAVFPRKKTCGGLVTKKTYGLIRELLAKSSEITTASSLSPDNSSVTAEAAASSGIDEDMPDLFSGKTNRVALYARSEVLVQTEVEEPMRFVDRLIFDHALVEQYRALGGTLYEGERNYSIEKDQKQIRLSDGDRISFRYLIFADGAQSSAYKLCGIRPKELAFGIETFLPVLPKNSREIAKAVTSGTDSRGMDFGGTGSNDTDLRGTDFNGTEPNGTESEGSESACGSLRGIDEIRLVFGYESKGYVWVFPYDKSLCVGAENVYQKGADHRKALFSFLKDSGTAPDTQKYSGAFFPCGYLFPQSKLPENMMLIGDAAGFADPISGEGLYFALHSGMLAARALLSEATPKQCYLQSIRPIEQIIKSGRRLRIFFYLPGTQKYFARHVAGNQNFIRYFFSHMVAEYDYSYSQILRLYRDYKRSKR